MKSLLSKLFKSSINSTSHKFVKRLARIQILPDHSISFHQVINNESRVLSIVNINSMGIAFSRDSSSSSPALGSIISGNLIINDIIYLVDVIVMHTNEKTIGCKFIDANVKLKKAISTYFFSELMASTLYQINPDILKHDPDGDQIFFFGEDRSELHLVIKDKKIVKFKISIMGEYLEVNKNGILSTGKVVDDDSEEGEIKYKGSHLIEKDKYISDEIKNRFIRFIKHADKLSIEYKNEMIEIIKNFKS